MPIYMRVPQNENEWKIEALNFEKMWHFPHCMGA
jgi:hypothetical protein